MGKNELIPLLGAEDNGRDSNVKYSPRPSPKKSPKGTSTLGVVSPSQYILSTNFFRWYISSDESVNQMWVMIPGPGSSRIVKVSPGATLLESSFPPEGS